MKDADGQRGPVDKELVVKTAAAIADSEGVDEVTLTRVAKELNISQPALYRHVDGYDDLIRSLGLEGRQVLVEALTAAALGVAGDDAVRQWVVRGVRSCSIVPAYMPLPIDLRARETPSLKKRSMTLSTCWAWP